MLFLIFLVALMDLAIGFVILVTTIANVCDFIVRDHGDFKEFASRIGINRWESTAAHALIVALGVCCIPSFFAAIIDLPTKCIRSKSLSSYWLTATGLVAVLLLVHQCIFFLDSSTYPTVVAIVLALSSCVALNFLCSFLVRQRTISRLRDSFDEP
jgi:amino acid transporter